MTADPDADRGLVPRDAIAAPGRWPAQRAAKVKSALVAGFGGFATISCLSSLTQLSGAPLLIAPFGASCVLVFALPASPLARPWNVIGGHLCSTLVGLAALALLGPSPLGFGVGVGAAIIAMLLTDTTHPPAGADPIVVILAGASWPFLFAPVLIGAVIIVSVGWVFHRHVTGRPYPNQT